MPLIRIEPLTSHGRWDSEFFTNPREAFMNDMLGDGEWKQLGDLADGKFSTGETPTDLAERHSGASLITTKAFEALALDESKFKPIAPAHLRQGLERARVESGDVVLTIKGKLVDACPVSKQIKNAAVSQDVLVMRPATSVKPGYLAAVLNSRIGKWQAERLQTGQITPYLNVTAVKKIQIPIIDEQGQQRIDALVWARVDALERAAGLEREARVMLLRALGITGAPRQLSLTSAVQWGEVVRMDRLDAEYFCYVAVSGKKVPFRPLSDPSVTTAVARGASVKKAYYAAADASGVPILATGDVAEFGLIRWRGRRVRADSMLAQSARGSVSPGDILMLTVAFASAREHIGRSALLHGFPAPAVSDCRASSKVTIIRPAGAILPEVLATYLNIPSTRQQVQRLIRGQAADVYDEDLGNLLVPILDDDVQRKIASLIQEAAEKRAKAETLLAQALTEVETEVLGALPGVEATASELEQLEGGWKSLYRRIEGTPLSIGDPFTSDLIAFRQSLLDRDFTLSLLLLRKLGKSEPRPAALLTPLRPVRKREAALLEAEHWVQLETGVLEKRSARTGVATRPKPQEEPGPLVGVVGVGLTALTNETLTSLLAEEWEKRAA